MRGRGGRRVLRRAPGGDGDRGFTIIELVVAMSLLATMMVGFAASIGFGFRTIALARQRTTAAEIASARLEHLRSLTLEQVALSEWPVYSANTENPDHWVSGDGLSYDITGAGDLEPLIVDDDGSDGVIGGVLHLEDPVQVGATVMEIYQYATWVDDPAIAGTKDYRRVTVVVRYKAPSINGVNRIVRMSSLFASDSITVNPENSPTSSTSPPATASTTTTMGNVVSCPGDVVPPTGDFTISGSNLAQPGYTAASNVTLNLSFSDTCVPIYARFSNDGSTFGGEIEYSAVSPTFSWSLSDGDGTKTVSGKVRDGAGNTIDLTPQSIVVDTVAPTTPGTLTRTVSCQSTNRTVALTWGVSTDDNPQGYRVYRSTDGWSWSALATTSMLTYADIHNKNLDSVRYYVVAYDKAGNESVATNWVTLAKNQCT